MTEIEPLLNSLTSELRASGARAVLLMGSHAWGTAHALSDVDIYALGDGPETELHRREGRLVTIAWRTPEVVAATFGSLPACVWAVPGWRSARILVDVEGEAAHLVQNAAAWRWDLVEDPDGWCADELPGYAEEVQKVRTALVSGDLVSAAIWRNVLAMRMALILAVHFRLLVEREEEIWPQVAELMGREWSRAQECALGLAPGSFEEGCEAAIELFRLAVDELAPFMTDERLAVARGALEGWPL